MEQNYTDADYAETKIEITFRHLKMVRPFSIEIAEEVVSEAGELLERNGLRLVRADIRQIKDHTAI